MCKISPVWFPNRLLEQISSHISWRFAKFFQYDFQTPSQIVCLNRCKVTSVACEWFSEMLVFTCLLKSPAWTDAKSNWIGLDWIGFTIVYWCCHHSKGCPISLIFSSFLICSGEILSVRVYSTGTFILHLISEDNGAENHHHHQGHSHQHQTAVTWF